MPTLTTMTFTAGGLSRTAEVWKPTGTNLPIVFAFHGHAGTAAGFAANKHFETYWANAIIVYPQGLVTKTAAGACSGFGWQRSPGEVNCVNGVTDWDLKFYDVMLSTFAGSYDPTKVFIHGWSNGGEFTYDALWVARASTITAMCCAAALLNTTSGKDTRPVMHIAGLTDNTVPFNQQQNKFATILTLDQCDPTGIFWASAAGGVLADKYISSIGKDCVFLQYDGGHGYPDDTVPPLIIQFFQNVNSATITVTANFLLNEYVTTNGNPNCPYPILTNKWSTITPAGFKNVMDFGAVGNGTTLDDNAIVACINAAQTANTGVIFPSGHTFAVSKLSTVNLTKDLTVWAYGATIKMADLKKYSWISFSFAHVQGGYGANFIWLGGTIDGNQFNQTYPLNPHGGIYDGAFVEAHGQFLNVTFADFALVKDITVINTVVDGVAVESCRLGIIANSTATGGAALSYAQVQEQGTYFKWTRQGFKTCYGLDLTTTGGSIGLHVSYPTADIMDTDTVAVFSNCHITGGAQNPVHIEDCYKVFNNNVTVENETSDTFNTPYHVSNRTGVFVLKGCNWRNAEATFNQARDMVLSMVDRCNFTSEFTGTSKINAFLDEKGVMLCTNSTFTGLCTVNQANIDSSRGCTFKNFNALAIDTAFAVDNCDFVNGTRPASLKNGGFVTPSCTFTNVSNPNGTSTPVDNTWKQIFLSSVQVYDGNQVFLGVIDTNPSCVGTTTTFYINSSTGNDSNNGTSPATPWRTLQKYTAGSTYLFNRGDTFYTKIPANNSTTAALPITLSAYGTGAKPIISNYTRIIAGWTLTSRTNVWSVNLATVANRSQFIPATGDLGNVGFLNVDGTIWGAKFSALTSLAKQWDFFSDGTNTLYVWSNGKPSTFPGVSSIQCTTSAIAVTPSNWWSMSEMKIQGGGGTLLRGITKNNVTLTNVDVTEGGGSYIGTGTTRFGAGVSFDEGASNILVDGCTMTLIYEAGFTMQSHQATSSGFTNCTFTNNIVDKCESGFNPDIFTGVANSPGFTNCRIANNTFFNAGTSWSHFVRPVDNQGSCIYQAEWDTIESDLIVENNTFHNPRNGLYYLGGKAADPRYTSRNNTICIDPNILIRKNCPSCPATYTYTLTGGATGLDYQDFVNQEKYEVGSTWYSYNASTGVCTLFSSLAGTYKTGTSSSTVCAQANTTLYTKGSFATGKTLYTDSGTTTAKTGATFVVQVSTNKIFNLNTTTGVIGADTGLICQNGTAGTYKTGSTLTTVCSQTNTTLYTSGAFAVGKTLFTDAGLTTVKTGATFVVTVTDNHIYNLNTSTGVIGSDTGNICNSGTAATYAVGNTLGTVCTATPLTLYTSGAFAIGKTLFTDINLLIKETGFLFVVQSSTNHVFNLNSTTAVVGSDTGTICGGGTGATYKLGNTLTTVCSATSVTLYTNGSFNVGDILYSDINLITPQTGFIYVVQVSTNHIFNLNSTTGVVGTDTGNICNSGTAGNYIVGNTLSTVCNGAAGTLYTSGAFAPGKTLYTDINLLIPKTGFIYVVQSSTGQVFELNSTTGVVGSDTGTICGEIPVDCTSSARKKYGIYGLGLINNLTQFNAFLPSMQGFHFRFVWSSYETSAGVFDSSYLIDQLKIAFNNCLYTGLEMFVAPQSNGITPAYVFQPPYNVPSVGTNAATDNTFPYYFYKDASNVFQFKQRYQNLNTQFRSDIAQAAAWSVQWQGRMLFLLSAEGYRGDENPYNGTPVNASFAITEASWNTYKQTEVWNVFYSAVNTSLSFLKLMINQGNDNSNFQWGLSNTATAWLKAGEFGQVYNFSNEKNYAALFISLKTSSTNNNRAGAELEPATTSSAWWTTSPSLNIMAMVLSALHAGVDILAIRPADALTNTTAYDFFNKYAGLRNATDSNIGFCALRDVIDLADLNRFSEATYGTLVASSDQATYNTQFNAINASGLPAAQIQYQLTHLLTSGNAGVPYVNATRITNLRNAFPTAGYQSINNDTPTTIQSYTQDFGVNMIAGNYSKFITQVNQNGTSVGVWKVTSVTDFWGRFGRRTDFATSKNELFFQIDSTLAANNNYRVTIKVTYLNNGGGTWVLNYFNATAKVSAGSTTNGATAASAQKTFTINDFQGGGNLTSATDFSLQRTAGADSTFFAVELTVVSQNTTGTAGTYIVGNTLSTVCAGAPVTLFTSGAFGVGKTLYSDIILLTPETGFTFVVNTATNHVFNLNTSTGVVGTDTGVVCGSGTAGVYKTSSTLSNVCSQAATTLYTSGSFAVGKTLYTDINLTTVKTGAFYVVTTSDNHIYNLDDVTGVIGADTGNICNSGTAGSYILGTVLSTVCAGSATTLYTSGSFAVGKTLYTDVNLLIAETGFIYVVTTTNNHVFNLNTSTGVIGADTGIVCGSGTAANYIVGNTLATVCDGATGVLFTSGSFAVGKTLYTDVNLTLPKTGFTFVVTATDSHVYNLNTSTGVVGSDTGIICNSGTAGTYILGNNSGTVCAGAPQTLYTSGSFAVGKTLYTTNDLTTAQTGFTFLVFNNEIYNLNTSTGVIGSDTTVSCTGTGTAGTYKVGNTLATVCAAVSGTLYTDGAFAIGGILYTDIGLTTPETGFVYVVNTATSGIYNLNTSTGVIGSQAGTCNGGTAATVKLGNTLSTVCAAGSSTAYTTGVFTIGKTLYSDINVTTAITGSIYVVLTATNHVYNLNTSTGVIGSDTGIVCGSGTSGTYRVGNTLSTVCSQTTGTLYTSGAFAVGKTLYTDINLTTTKTGFVYVEETVSNHVYNLNTSTGVVGSDTGIVCGSGTGAAYKLGNDITTVCGTANLTLYTSGTFNVGDVLYTDVNLTLPQTGFTFVTEVGSNHVFNLNTSTGVVGSDTGTICGSGTSGTYKLGNTFTTVCNQGDTTLYTSGIFAVGGTLYTDINLTIPQTGFVFVVRTDTNFIYNLNTSTGVIGSRTNKKCGSGKPIIGKKN